MLGRMPIQAPPVGQMVSAASDIAPFRRPYTVYLFAVASCVLLSAIAAVLTCGSQKLCPRFIRSAYRCAPEDQRVVQSSEERIFETDETKRHRELGELRLARGGCRRRDRLPK